MSTPPRRIIPREEVSNSDWQPLVFSSINDPRPPRMRKPEPAPTPVSAEQMAAAAALQAVAAEPVAAPVEAPVVEEPAAPDIPDTTAADLDAVRQQAHEEGFNAGHAEGLDAGRMEAANDTQRMRQIIGQLENFTRDASADLAETVLDLALVIARELARVQIEQDPQRVLPVVREMIESLPVVKPPARILANPDDVTALESMLGADLPTDTWRLVPDANIEPGGCKIETTNTRADLTLNTRWMQQLRVLRRADRDDLSWQAGAAQTEPEPEPAAAPAPTAPVPAAQPAPAPTPVEQIIAPPTAAEPATTAAPAAGPAQDLLAQFDPHALDIASPAPAATPSDVEPVTPAEAVSPVEDNARPV